VVALSQNQRKNTKKLKKLKNFGAEFVVRKEDIERHLYF